jgi:hypothetical protein
MYSYEFAGGWIVGLVPSQSGIWRWRERAVVGARVDNAGRIAERLFPHSVGLSSYLDHAVCAPAARRRRPARRAVTLLQCSSVPVTYIIVYMLYAICLSSS